MISCKSLDMPMWGLKSCLISIDKNISSWKKAVQENKDIMTDTNCFLLETTKQDFISKKLNISTIPRYILFGKNGNIISSDAPRPSDHKLTTLLENISK